MVEKVKVRIQGSEKDVQKLREILLDRCPELILGSPRRGTNPKYEPNQKYASYGDFQFNTKRNKKLCTLIAMVASLSIPFDNSSTWADVLTTSFTKHCSRLHIDVPYDDVILGLKTILEAFERADKGINKKS